MVFYSLIFQNVESIYSCYCLPCGSHRRSSCCQGPLLIWIWYKRWNVWPHIVTVNHSMSSHENVSDKRCTVHTLSSGEWNSSITNVPAELQSRKFKGALIDVPLYEKNIDSNSPHSSSGSAMSASFSLHPSSAHRPVPSTMKVEQICWHWSCLLGRANFIPAGERRLSPKILTDNCIYYFLFTSQ